MVRKLKHHEQKLLRRHNFIEYKQDQNHRAAEVARRYMIQKPEQYHILNKLCGVCFGPQPSSRRDVGANSLSLQSLRQLAHRISLLPPENATRQRQSQLLLDKLYDMGVLNGKSKLSDVEKKVTVASFARRRLPVVM